MPGKSPGHRPADPQRTLYNTLLPALPTAAECRSALGSARGVRRSLITGRSWIGASA
jgi:hypothetical protein